MFSHRHQSIAAVVLAIGLLFSQSGVTSAYNLGPGARFQAASIADGVLSICFGVATTEGLYTNRQAIVNYFDGTWGPSGYGKITIVSNGLCDNDGSNLKILWDRGLNCAPGSTDPWGYVNSSFFEWTEQTVWINADCNIRGRLDWSQNGPLWDNGQFTVENQIAVHDLIMHEIGHAIGLGHSPGDPRAIMYPASNGPPSCPNVGYSQGLALDDTDGLKAEYSGAQYAPWNATITNAPVAALCWH